MTLDEAINREEEIVEGFEKTKKIRAVTEYEYQCTADHRQLAEWLRELKRYKEQDKPQWISTKDKLPDNKSYVLTTIKIPGRQPHVRSGWYQDGHFLNDNGDFWNDTEREVVGWQYQPEPMGKGSEC